MAKKKPLEMPEDLSTLSAEEFAALADSVRATATELAQADPPAAAADIFAARDAYTAVRAEESRREEATAAEAAARTDLAALLSADTDDGDDDEDEDDTDEEDGDEGDGDGDAETPAKSQAAAVVATRGQARTGSRRRSTLDQPTEKLSNRRSVVMSTATDVPGFGSGIELTSFKQAATALGSRLEAYPSNGAPRTNSRITPARGKHAYTIQPGRSAIRHGTVMFKRQFDEQLRIRSGGSDPLEVVKFASSEKRLPGGSLVKSAQKLIKEGRALTAAVGWCAPSETLYELCELSTLAGMLDIAEIQATRGGFQIPADGGPDFSVLWSGIGDEGNNILTEYDVENGTEKICYEIPCQEFVDVRMQVAYLCLTGSLLQNRGYPEVVDWFAREAVKASAHKVNAATIAMIVAAAGAAIVIPEIAASDDAASALLSAIELAIWDMRYRHRMSPDTTLEVVLPYWMIAPIRAGLARRRGVYALAVTDSEIMEMFAVRNAVPRFVYDWQDAYTGGAGGGRPGGATPITALPTTGQFLIYPAGTFVKMVRDVVNLDTIYDNAMLTTNNYTALFVEDGFGVLQTCPEVRLYTVTLNPDGVVGCCA